MNFLIKYFLAPQIIIPTIPFGDEKPPFWHQGYFHRHQSIGRRVPACLLKHPRNRGNVRKGLRNRPQYKLPAY